MKPSTTPTRRVPPTTLPLLAGLLLNALPFARAETTAPAGEIWHTGLFTLTLPPGYQGDAAPLAGEDRYIWQLRGPQGHIWIEYGFGDSSLEKAPGTLILGKSPDPALPWVLTARAGTPSARAAIRARRATLRWSAPVSQLRLLSVDAARQEACFADARLGRRCVAPGAWVASPLGQLTAVTETQATVSQWEYDTATGEFSARVVSLSVPVPPSVAP